MSTLDYHTARRLAHDTLQRDHFEAERVARHLGELVGDPDLPSDPEPLADTLAHTVTDSEAEWRPNGRQLWSLLCDAARPDDGWQLALWLRRGCRDGTLGQDVCRRCGQPVLWVRTTHGTKIPLDPRPNLYRFGGRYRPVSSCQEMGPSDGLHTVTWGHRSAWAPRGVDPDSYALRHHLENCRGIE